MKIDNTQFTDTRFQDESADKNSYSNLENEIENVLIGSLRPSKQAEIFKIENNYNKNIKLNQFICKRNECLDREQII